MLTLPKFLTKIPLVSNVIEFFTGRVRLLIEYGIICALVIVSSVCFTLWLKNKQVEKDLHEMHESVGGLHQTIEAQNSSIQTLVEMRQRDGLAIEGLIKDLNKIADGNHAFETKLKELEKTNAQVKELVNIGVPDALKCLLQPARCPNGIQSSGSGSKQPTPEPTSKAVPTSK